MCVCVCVYNPDTYREEISNTVSGILNKHNKIEMLIVNVIERNVNVQQ